MRIKDAAFHPNIIGYGVSDSGARHGGGDESAEHGLCYPNSQALTLPKALDLQEAIGQDAAVIAFFDNGREPEAVTP